VYYCRFHKILISLYFLFVHPVERGDLRSHLIQNHLTWSFFISLHLNKWFPHIFNFRLSFLLHLLFVWCCFTSIIVLSCLFWFHFSSWYNCFVQIWFYLNSVQTQNDFSIFNVADPKSWLPYIYILSYELQALSFGRLCY
jgi:hypothetical protein